MVFEKKHYKVNGKIGRIAGVDENGYENNTNASGYINKIRMDRIKKQRGGETVKHNDPPPEDT